MANLTCGSSEAKACFVPPRAMTVRSGLPLAVGLAVGLVVGLAVLPRRAEATYSIVAVDRRTGEIGSAFTSCVNFDPGMDPLFRDLPGRGAIIAQANLDVARRARAIELLGEGRSPAEILRLLTDPASDSGAGTRQYGIVASDGRTAGYTGAQLPPWAGDRQGTVGDISYSIQGNLLTGEQVIAQAEAAFRGGGCDLADRLMRGIEAGAAGGNGDVRCADLGIPSDVAFLHVRAADGTRLTELKVARSGSEGAVKSLRRLHDEWRAENPCHGPRHAASGRLRAHRESSRRARSRGLSARTIEEILLGVGACLVGIGVGWRPLRRRRFARRGPDRIGPSVANEGEPQLSSDD